MEKQLYEEEKEKEKNRLIFKHDKQYTREKERERTRTLKPDLTVSPCYTTNTNKQRLNSLFTRVIYQHVCFFTSSPRPKKAAGTTLDLIIHGVREREYEATQHAERPGLVFKRPLRSFSVGKRPRVRNLAK